MWGRGTDYWLTFSFLIIQYITHPIQNIILVALRRQLLQEVQNVLGGHAVRRHEVDHLRQHALPVGLSIVIFT